MYALLNPKSQDHYYANHNINVNISILRPSLLVHTTWGPKTTQYTGLKFEKSAMLGNRTVSLQT